jgi:hypothetical protein
MPIDAITLVHVLELYFRGRRAAIAEYLKLKNQDPV